MKATFIPAEGTARVVELPENNHASEINRLVGGWFDCVSRHGYTAYVHDEGLLIGLRPNNAATLLTGQVLVGDVVLVGNLSPTGEYDGEDYELPEELVSEAFLVMCTAVNMDENLTAELTPEAERLADGGIELVELDKETFEAMFGEIK